MKYLSICSGIEAASVAWEGLGWEAAGFSEIEPFPCAVLNYRFPHVHNFGDLTKNETWKIERGAIDVICGGTPCQSFSVAGLRAGMADPRGNLALTFLSLCDRLRPEWIIWENVPGVLSSNGGRDLGAFLGALGKLGYGTAYRILDAQYFGVAQRRRRIFVVANLTDWRRAAAVLFEPESLRGDSAKGGKARKGAPAGAGNGAETNGGMFWNGSQISQTLDAVLAKGQTMPEKNRFPAVLVPPAPANPSHWEGGPHPTLTRINGQVGYSDQELFSQRGAMLAPAIPIQDGRGLDKGQNGLGIGGEGDPSYTLDTMGAASVAAPAPSTYSTPAIGHIVADRIASTLTRNTGAGGETQNPAFVVTPAPLAFTQNSREEVRLLGDLSGSLPASSGSHLTTYAAIPLPAPEPFVKAKRAQSVDDDETWEAGRPAPTLSVFDSGDTRATVAIVTPEPIAFHPTQDPISSVGVTHTMGTGTTGGAATIAVAQAYAVRRLTPVECERLQGFPDDWTNIPFRGKPAADGPRYKAIGNSMAVPVMRWIGERIAIVDRATKGEG